MKKVLKIIAFVLLIALAVISFGKALEYIIAGYNTIYTYLYIVFRGGAVDHQHKLSAISYLWIIFTCLLNSAFCVIYSVLLYNNVYVSEKIKALIKEIPVKIDVLKERQKQKRLEKLKSKIKKIEDDE